MKILFLIASEGYFGAENMLVALARGLSAQGVHCVIGAICDARFVHSEVTDRAAEAGLETVLIPCAGKIDLAAIRTIRKLIRRQHIDLLHCHGYKADTYARFATPLKNCATVSTCHNWPSKLWKMRAYALIDQVILRGFDRVVAVSESVLDQLKPWVDSTRLYSISNGIDTTQFNPAGDTTHRELGIEGRTVIGFVGRFVADKGGELLLRAAERVLQKRPQASVVLVGDGPERDSWRYLAAELGIADKVVFTGVRRDMPEIYRTFDIFVLPSKVEAMPMCVLEAMACGVPVLATPVGSIPDLVKPGDTGCLTDYGDVDALATNITTLIDDLPLRARMGTAARAFVLNEYSSRAMAARYLSLYQAALTERGRQIEEIVHAYD